MDPERRKTLEATRRNVRAVDWLQAVPDMIAEALDHVADRYRHENAILTNIRKARDETEEVGRGTHERVVIDLRRAGERLAAKAKRAAT